MNCINAPHCENTDRNISIPVPQSVILFAVYQGFLNYLQMMSKATLMLNSGSAQSQAIKKQSVLWEDSDSSFSLHFYSLLHLVRMLEEDFPQLLQVTKMYKCCNICCMQYLYCYLLDNSLHSTVSTENRLDVQFMINSYKWY